MGVDIAQLHAILKAKLLIDSRRKSGLFTGMEIYSSSYGPYIFLFILFLTGCGVLALSLIFRHVPTGLALYFSIWMVLLSMTVVMDFSDVLIDTKDSYTLLPTPVNDATLSISRILRILIYLSKQAFVFILPALIYWFINDKLGMLVFMLQAFLTLVMSVSLVTLFYFAAIKFTSPARLKNLINNLQIVFTITIIGGYYLLPELIDQDDIRDTYLFGFTYSYLAPPAWIAAIWELLMNKAYNNEIFIHVALSIAGSFGALVFISKYLAKDFSQQLFSANMASTVETAPSKSKQINTSDGEESYLGRIASYLTGDKVEKAAFKFCFRYLGRDRKFKLKTYPILGYVPIMVVSGFISGEGSLAERFADIQSSDYYVFTVYVAAFLGQASLMHALYSDIPSQTWIFRSTPISHPKSILYALYKVVCVKFILPAWIILFCFSIGIWGPRMIDDFLFGGVALLFINVFLLKVTFKSLPFTKPWSDLKSGSNSLVMFLLWIGIAIIVAIHYFFLKDSILYMVLAATTLIIVFYFIWRSMDSLTWEKLEWD